MLILTRRIGESIMMGDDIEIVITNVFRNKAQIGVDSPRGVKVLRAELCKYDVLDDNETDLDKNNKK